MSGYKIVAHPADVVYVYDGSAAGFLCCVHESFYTKTLPASIVSETDFEPTLYALKFVTTDETKALAVRRSIAENVSKRTLDLVGNVFLCHHANRELKLLRFLISAFRIGPKVMTMLGTAEVAEVLAMERHLLGERHLLLGFIRFKDYGQMLGAVISPKNFVLPLLGGHFTGRYPNENFIIYDKTHKAALIFQDKRLEIAAVDDIQFADEPETERHYQDLWKNFYNTIGIKERLNPRCRMSHMPKRYWENMIEMQPFL